MLDPTRYLVIPGGLVDVHVHFRDPGVPEAETRASGAAAAAAGGFSLVVTMPNTTPAGDNPAWIREQIEDDSLPCRIWPSACITKGRLGAEVADLEALAAAGAAFFTDDGSYVADAKVMREAMVRAAKLGKAVCQHAVVPELLGAGVIRNCPIARKYNLPVMPPEAETEAVRRDIALVRETGCALHVQHISCAETVELIRSARREGLPVSGEATPHHLLLSCEDIPANDANFKMAPPLGCREDRAEIRRGVIDGTLSMFATDHAPHLAAKKQGGFIGTANGIVGLETAVAVTYQAMVVEEGMSEQEWVARWTTGPLALLGLPQGLSPSGVCPQLGSVPNKGLSPSGLGTTIIDRKANKAVEPANFKSKSRNTPFAGMTFAAWPVES